MANKLPQLVFAGFALVALAVYAVEQQSGPRTAFHSFGFGSFGDDEGIEVLNYQYGDSKLTGTRPLDYPLQQGHIEQGSGVGGEMPVADYLYVKWRVLSTGKEYEDRVDLKSRLPWSMKDKIVHFNIKGAQLYVYLIEGNDAAHLHAHGGPDCPLPIYKHYKCTELYPQHWTNF